jgi:arginyl-tRNA synthetase
MKAELEKRIAEACHELFEVETMIELTRPEEHFGDYATNVALQLGHQLARNPRELAEALATKLRETLAAQISEVTVAGPGFLNLKLNDPTLLSAITAQSSKSLAGQTIVAEYSDPNPFKVLHAGHLYTSVVGDAIANLLEQAGATVHRVNFGGDVGLHVGKSMWAIIQKLGGEKPDALASLVLEDLDFRARWLAERYIEGHEAYESNEAAKADIISLNKKVYALHEQHDHDTPFAKIYWTCRDWSYDYFKHFYATIGVKPFHFYPESQTAPIGVQKAQELLKQGVLETSEGAVVFKGEKYDLHTRVFLTKEGLPTYETKDLGLTFAKYDDYHFDRSIIITGNDIIEYMKVVLKVVEQTAANLAAATTHVTHGLVRLAGGEKMSSRKGNVVSALDIISSAAAAARESHTIDDKAAEKATIFGAVKYAFLKNRIGGDIIYDPKESVSLEGNSGPYLQYAHVRARSILRKADESSDEPAATDLQPSERSLVRKISEYPEVVDKAVAELMPHHVCSYLYELAQTFNRFYENNRVIDDPRQALRLKLVQAYADTLHGGLNVLGIASPDKM